MPRDPSAAPPPQTPPPARPPERSGASVFAAISAASLLAAGYLTAPSEGFVAKARPDPVGVLTGCYGERVDMSDLDPARTYTEAECRARLEKRMAAQYGPPVARCAPELTAAKRQAMFAAFLDGAWNSGPKAVCASPMAAALHAGDDVGACLAFLGWKVAPKGKLLTGLLVRREKEARLCFGRKP